MRRTTVLCLLVSTLALALAGSAAASPLSLAVSQSLAFSYLGHSCGGIKEQAFATGFDAASDDPVGAVYLQTRCSTGGRGGRTITYSAWIGVTWDFGGAVVSSAALATPPSVDPSFSTVDANGDHLFNVLATSIDPSTCSVGNTTYCTYRAYLDVPAAAAPTILDATQVGDQFQLSWQPAPAIPAVITSSTLTATPVASGAPVVTSTVAGSATTGLVGPLQAATTYQITVASNDAGGSSPPSAPVTVTTHAASIPPSAPTGVTAHWTAPGYPTDSLVATWVAPDPGDAPIDKYRIKIVGSDLGGTFTQTVSASTLTATFAVSDIPDWSVSVKAHNAAGWGAWSKKFLLGGV